MQAIRQTKCEYFRCFDTANVEESAETLTKEITPGVVEGV
jgi:hypothetical protein